MKNRRRLERFKMNLLTFARVAQEDGSFSDHIFMMASNISAGGAFLMTEHPLKLETFVHMGIFLPTKNPANSESPQDKMFALIKTTGRVVRCEEQGMAIQFDKGYSISPLFKRRRRD